MPETKSLRVAFPAAWDGEERRRRLASDASAGCVPPERESFNAKERYWRLPLLLGITLPVLLLASGCANTIDKLEQVGKPPPHTAVEDPVRKPTYEPLSWPMPASKPHAEQYANSLWQPGSRAFFRDQRAARTGDILRVNININDQAQVNNQTERKRDGTQTSKAANAVGVLGHLFGGIGHNTANNNPFINTTSFNDNKGTGTVQRTDKIVTQVAALVTQVLPNGNLVIDGKQELLVNYEMREISIKGVIRPEDIRADNSVDSTQIAEARITYSGRGQLMDVQQPTWGNQVLDVISPF